MACGQPSWAAARGGGYVTKKDPKHHKHQQSSFDHLSRTQSIRSISSQALITFQGPKASKASAVKL
eukprot:1154431-Pelagomonas_calceolata.AAC.1